MSDLASEDDAALQEAILKSILSEETRKIDQLARNKKLEEDRELRRQQDEELAKSVEDDQQALLNLNKKDIPEPLSREALRLKRLQHFG